MKSCACYTQLETITSAFEWPFIERCSISLQPFGRRPPMWSFEQPFGNAAAFFHLSCSKGCFSHQFQQSRAMGRRKEWVPNAYPFALLVPMVQAEEFDLCPQASEECWASCHPPSFALAPKPFAKCPGPLQNCLEIHYPSLARGRGMFQANPTSSTSSLPGHVNFSAKVRSEHSGAPRSLEIITIHGRNF